MAQVETRMASARVRWGELEEDENEDLDFLLPPPQIIGPDENGVKKIIEYKFNDQGQKVMRTTTTRIRKVAKARLNKRALERREWRKFGDAANEDASSRLTMVSTEEILLERPRPPGSKADDAKSGADALSALAGAKGGAVLMVCRICGKKGDHWTSKCPYKDLAPAGVTADGLGLDKAPPAEIAATAAAGGGATGRTTYVPPSLRGGVDRSGDTMRRRNDENSVRVTNLSEDTRDADLHELFKPFGNINRVYVAMDQKTGVSRGFGFVNFANREDAQRAINKLNGYGYDNLILRVEWATPRQN
uniref:Eukaryotic translation initiation factor 3 subunit G n=1 Tax=Araucaria cunninghamii TaxID=56994 RepID=A0A0D6QU29_ARACU